MPTYEPARYWSERLKRDFNLTGVGHVAFSPAYNRWPYRRKQEALATALTGMPAGVPALDIGSGVGWVVGQLRDYGLAVDGCDITEIAVERLTIRFPNSAFFQLNLGAELIPRDDASLWLVTMLDVAYHITDDDLWRTGIRDIARVLKPGGRLVITDRLATEPIQASDHVRFRSKREWATVADNLGLRLNRVDPLYSWLSRSKRVRGWSWIPDELRGRLEYRLEDLVPKEPHLRWAVLVKDA
jgi:SAM-dependent methyltransferase